MFFVVGIGVCVGILFFIMFFIFEFGLFISFLVRMLFLFVVRLYLFCFMIIRIVVCL